MRDLSCASKPFITDKTVTSDITPIVIPAVDI
ncbi:Uncharacterised protein [Vibrio cholerae]|nr:Uncharacterised protein [Vibrio cholerae]CSC59519.1 Uncharacterised protein [Vibrio cholerae]